MNKTCSISGCTSTGRTVKGLCNAHYLKQRKYGDPLHVARPAPPPGKKTCCVCGETLALEDFNRSARSKDGHYPSCRACANARKRASYASDPAAVLERSYASRQRNLEARREKERQRWANRDTEAAAAEFRKRHLRRKFGITPEQYDVLLEGQGGVCGSCGQPEVDVHYRTGRTRLLAVDHDHVTGRIRGLLCRRCNTALGLLGDDAEGVTRLLDYLG